MNKEALLTGWRRILVATDFSRTSRLALASAARLARGTGAEIVLVHVEADEARVEEARVALRAMALQARTRGARIAEVEVCRGRTWVGIVEAASRHGADLVVIGNSGRGRFNRLLLGSTAENVLRHSPFPVLVTRRRALRGLRRVLLPVSADEASLATLDFAIERLTGDFEIEAFHAVPTITAVEPWMFIPPPQTDEAAFELREFLDGAGAWRVRAQVAVGNDASAAIMERARAWGADLILLGTHHGRAGLAHMLLGSVAEKVARYADRPVLILPSLRRPRAQVPAQWDEAVVPEVAPAELALAWG
jgi:nucleotide-binding universal stress UspA family protein